METSWLQDFLAVIQEGGFSRAAGRRSISQPAFSRRIRSLEDWVGARLFDRVTHAVELTAAGRRLRPFAEEILSQLEAGRLDARDAATVSGDMVLFASTHVLSLTFFPTWLRWVERHMASHFRVQLTADSMSACERLMIEGNAQFLLCHQHPAAECPLGADRFTSVVLGEDKLIPVAAPHWIDKDVLHSGPFLAYSASSGMGRILTAVRDKGGHDPWPEPVFASHLASVLATMAREGRGVAFSPLSLVSEDLAAGTLVQLGEEADVISMDICLVRPRARQTQAAEQFWDSTRACR